MMSDIQNLSLDALNGLSEQEKKLALEILKQYSTNGESELLDELQNFDFEEVPVDISTFIHDKKYLGNGLYDQEGRFTLFPYWENKLKEVFPSNTTTAYNTIVLTGAIGIGKTLFADICLLYMLYRLLCLKDPYLYYGMQPIDKISISFMNVTIENAKGVALDKMNQLILSSDWFMSHGEMGGTTNLIFRPQKHIELIAASSNNQIVGRALFASFEDEVNFALFSNPEKQKKKMMKIITQIDARMRSRFLRGTYLPTLNIIASSKDTEQSFLEAYIDDKIKNESVSTLIVDEAQWVVDPRKDSETKFYVAIGNKFLANELLPLNVDEEILNEYSAKGYQLVKVPIGYLEVFQGNLDEAICSIIGIATASSLKYISGVKLNEIKTETYENPFVKDVIEVGNGKDDLLQYSNFFDLSRVSKEDLIKPLFIHLDMSTGSGGKGDKTGIAGVWITGREKHAQTPLLTGGNTNAALEQSEVDIANDLHFKVAFSVSIQAPKGAQISFTKNRYFIKWLREQGFAVKCVSMDTFQSAPVRQDLINDGFKIDVISVDRVSKDGNGRPLCLPYHYFKSAIYEHRLSLYQKCDQLTNEIIGLERKSDGHIDHTKEGIDSKDQADAVCGAVWAASKFSEEFSYSYGDNLSVMLDANEADNADELQKHKLVAAFEEELKNIFIENSSQTIYTQENTQRNDEWEDFSDLSNGIIIF